MNLIRKTIMGFYLNLWIEYFVDDGRRTNSISTFKTLDENNQTMHIMAKLLADFIIEEYSFVNANFDDFTWEGFGVHAFDEEGKRYGWGYLCHYRVSIKQEKRVTEKISTGGSERQCNKERDHMR